MGIFLQCNLDASHEQFKAGLWERHLKGPVAESVKVPVGAKNDGISVLVAVALEALPNGGSVVERTAGGREGKIGLVILFDGIKDGTRIGGSVVVVLRPFSGGRREVDVGMLFGMIEIPWKGFKVDALFGGLDFGRWHVGSELCR